MPTIVTGCHECMFNDVSTVCSYDCAYCLSHSGQHFPFSFLATKYHLYCPGAAVLRLLLNLARAEVFIHTGRFSLSHSWPLDMGMIFGGWLGLICGNACAHFFRDATALHWW